MTLTYLFNSLGELDPQVLFSAVVWISAAVIAGAAFQKCFREEAQ